MMSVPVMRQFLSRSISSRNRNKLHGILAEIDLRSHLSTLGFGRRISAGGWIFRSVLPAAYGEYVSVFFPAILRPYVEYSDLSPLEEPDHGLHSICSTFHQIGIHSYYCAPTISEDDDPSSVCWHHIQLGLPTQHSFEVFPRGLTQFAPRPRQYSFLRHHTDVAALPDVHVPEEFSKEHFRIAFQSEFYSEASDVDGVLWGNQHTYPIEIKEKTVAHDPRVGDYFGLDLGPFVKLAFYAAKRGNLHSLFVVREIDNTISRELVDWWYITFDELALYASWTHQGGGTSMGGGRSSVVRIPKARFHRLDSEALQSL